MSAERLERVAIIPAAGHSRRMGRDKLLLPWGGTVVVGAVAAALHAGGVSRVVLVAAADNEPLRSWGRRAGLELALNRQPERGMLSSVWEGIEALGGADRLRRSGTALLVCPGDHPALEPATVRAVVAALDGGADLVVPTVAGERGHPLGIASDLVAEILDLDPDVGLRQLLDRHPPVTVEVDDRGAAEDVDRPADYERLVDGS